MIRRIRLINFMSHSNTVIEPADGLTILVGQNNCGKSAIVTALQILSGNATGDFMVRHGERECVVAVETDDGHEIEWRRKGGTVSYRLNGRDVHRLQRCVPDDLHDLLRLPAVHAEGGDFDIHFAEQKNPIFLINEPASRRATFFASSSDAIKLIEMQNVHRHQIQEARARESEFVKREGKLKARLEALQSIDDISNQLRDLEAFHIAVVGGSQAIEGLQRLTQDVAIAAFDSKKWTAKARALSKLTPPPQIGDTKQLVDAIDRIAETTSEALRNQDACTVLRSLKTAPALRNITPILDIIDNLVSTQFAINANAELLQVCRPLGVPPDLPSTLAMSGATKALEIAVISVQAIGEQCMSLATLSAPPVAADAERLREVIRIQSAAVESVALRRTVSERSANIAEPPITIDLKGLANTIDQIVELEQRITRNELEVQQFRADLAETEHDLRHLADELDSCPICGQNFDADRLVAATLLQVGE